MINFVVKAGFSDNRVESIGNGLCQLRRGVMGLGLLGLLATGCGKGKGNDIDLSGGQETGTSTLSGSNSATSTQSTNGTTTTAPQDTTGTTGATTPGVTTSFDPGILTSLDLGTTSGTGTGTATGTGTGPSGQRDCSKIKWGDRLKEGEIIARGDVSGYIDTDGDGLVEEKLRDAGMCQMHLSGKRCGLMMYGRWG